MRRILVGLIVLTIGITICHGQVTAMTDSGQQTMGIQAGEKELGFAITGMSSDAGGTTVMIMGSCGYFLTSHFQLKVIAMVMSYDDNTLGIFGGATDFIFGTSLRVAPYVGAGLLVAGGDLDTTAMIDIHGGLKHFMSEGIAINYEIKSMSDISDPGEMIFVSTIGLNFYWQ